MSNYQRTMELMGYATNSAGASQKQFEKTMDSLESKLNRLHDAWEQYVTGIANQSIIKGVVDLLTNLLKTVNEVTDALDPFHTGWSKILAAFLGFKAAKGVVNGVLKGIGAQLGTRSKTGLDEKQGTVDGTKYGKGFWGAFQKMQAQKKDPMGARPITSNIKQSKQLTKEAAELKKSAAALKSQETELTKLEKQYKDYSNTIATANTQGKNSQKIASKSRTAILQQNQALQRQEASLRENLSVESEAYRQSVARTAKLQEQEAALTGKSAALTKDTAEQFANTSSEELNTAAATANQGAMEMETAAKEKEALATEMNTAITTKDTIEQEANNMTRLQAIAGLFSLNSTKRLAAAVSLGLMSAEEAEAIATGGATAAQTAFNAALYACPIMWIIAAVVALVAALAIFATIHETTEEKVQRLNKSVEQLGTQMQETQSAITDLTDSWDELSGLKDDLNDLTVGTTEWKKKLIEVNQEVLNLLDKYPQLAQYVSKNANGELEINKSGYDKVLDTQLESLTRQQQAYSFAQALSADMQRTQLSEEYTHNYTEKQKNKQQMSQRAIERDSFFSTGIANLGTDYSDKQKKIGNLLTDEEKSLISTVSANEQSLKNFEKIKSKTSASVTEYARLTGLTEAQVKAKKDQNELDDDAIKTLIATNKYQKEYEKQAAQLVSILRSNDLTELEKRAISGTNSLTLEDVKNKDINDVFSKYIKDGVVKIDEDDSDSIKKILTDTFGFEEGTLNSLLEAGASLESIVQNFVNSKASLKSYEENLSKLGKVNSDSFSSFTNSIQKISKQKLSTDQLNQLSKTFLKVKEQGGDIKSFSSQLESIVSTIKKPEDLQKFISSLNSVDFSSETAIRTFADNLSELGINLQDNVKSELVDATEAAKDFDLSKVTDQLMNFELAEQIQSKAKDNNRVFTADEYKKIEEDKKAEKFLPDFVQRGTSYVFTGDWDALTKALLAADDIVKAEEDYTKALLDLNDKQTRYANARSKAGNLRDTNNKTIWDFDDSWINGDLAYFISGTPKKFNNPGELDADYLNSLIYQYDDDGQVMSDPNGEADIMFDWDKIAQIFAEANENEDFAKALPADFYKKVGERIAAGYVEDNTPEQGAAIDSIRRFLGVEFEAVTFDELEGLLSDYADKNDTWTNTQLAANQKFLKPYLENNIITQTQYEEWSKKTAEEVRQLIDSINFDKESTDAFSNKQNLESKQFIGLTSAKEIISIAPETEAGLKAQQEAIEAIIIQHKDYEIELQKIQKELGLTEEAAKKYLAVQYEQREATNSIKTVLSDYKDTLSVDNLSLTKNTEDYYTAISLLVDKFKVLFGENITQEWVENNLDAIRELNSSDLSVAQQAMEKLQSTAEATKFTFNIIGTGDASGEIDETIFAKISKSIGQAQKDINTNTNKLTTDFNTIKSALQELDGSEASVSIKANTRAKAMEAIKDMIAVIVTQKFAESDPNKVATYDSKLQILQQLASNLGFSVNIASNVGAGYEHGGATLRWDSKSNKWVDIKDTFDAKRMITITDTQGQQITMGTPEAAGTGNTTNSSSKDSDSNKKTTKDTASTWTNDWDRQYAVLKKIESLERERNSLSKEQQRFLKTGLLNEKKILKTKEDQRRNLTQQVKLNEDLVKDADAWLRGMNNDGRFDGAIWWDDEYKTIRTDDAYIRSMDEDTKKEFDKVKADYEHYYSQRNTANSNIDAAIDAIEGLTSSISELDFHSTTEKLIAVIDNVIDLYDKAEKRLEWSERNVNSKDIVNLYDAKGKELIEKSKALTTDFIQTEATINTLLNKPEYKKYYNYDWKTGKVTTTGAYDAIVDSDIKSNVKDFIDKLNTYSQQRASDDSERIDIQDTLREMEQAILTKAESFRKNVYDAIVNQREEEISRLENINSSIQSAAADLVSSIQKNIQKIRQERSNKKTEEELAKMQSRLDFLRMDTSSGNQKTILDLEKQLEEKEQSYTDTLIDQKISELQDQNTEAEKQRKQQIEVMKTQLEVQKDNGLIWSDVRYLIANGLSASGKIKEGSELDTALKSWGKYSSLSEQGKKDWLHEQNLGASNFDAYYSQGLNNRDYDQKVDYSANGADKSYDVIKQQMINAYKQGLIESINNTTPYRDYMRYDSKNNKLIQTKLFPHPDDDKALNSTLQNAWDQAWSTINTIYNLDSYFEANSGKNIVFTHVPNIARYATGGLADYTGPAWLDGTPSSPELVLNQRDTKNFIQLKDILSSVMNDTSTQTKPNGDYYFEIEINVDKVTSDYDVDQIADRIKQQISDSARYRNVNVINLLR